MIKASATTQAVYDVLAEDLEARRNGAPLGSEETRKAVSKRDWQELRLALLGTTHEAKFDRLREWVDTVDPEGSDPDARVIQVLNYIYALRRGGILGPPEKIVRVEDPRRI